MNIDYIITEFFANNHSNPVLNAIMVFFSNIGDNAYIFLLLAAFLLPFVKHRKFSIGLVTTIVIAWIINDFILKKTIARPRPFIEYPEFLPNVLYEIPTSMSFPSGHTNVAFACMTFTRFMGKPYRKTAIAFTCLAVLIGFSRIYCVHHFFTDVIAGAALGSCWGIAGFFATKYIFKLFEKIKNKHLSNN